MTAGEFCPDHESIGSTVATTACSDTESAEVRWSRRSDQVPAYGMRWLREPVQILIACGMRQLWIPVQGFDFQAYSGSFWKSHGPIEKNLRSIPIKVEKALSFISCMGLCRKISALYPYYNFKRGGRNVKFLCIDPTKYEISLNQDFILS